MSVKISGRYLGNKKIELVHEPSGMKISTAAPLDNNGDGSSFSPTDLLTASLGACAMTVMSIYAERHGIDLSGMHMQIEKIMSAEPRRVASLPLSIHMPAAITDEQRSILERVAATCPVKRSLSPETEVTISFKYDV